MRRAELHPSEHGRRPFDAEITDAALTAHYDLPRQEFGIGNDSYGDKLLDPLVPVDVKLVFLE